jgi:predicted GTPase
MRSPFLKGESSFREIHSPFEKDDSALNQETCCFLDLKNQYNTYERKTYLLVGLTGAGKSMTGNCILNQSGALSQISDTPFPSSDRAISCTQKFSSPSQRACVCLGYDRL